MGGIGDHVADGDSGVARKGSRRVQGVGQVGQRAVGQGNGVRFVRHRGRRRVGGRVGVGHRHTGFGRFLAVADQQVVAGIQIDDDGIGAGATDYRVGAVAALKHVIAGVANDGVVQRVAGTVDIRGAGEFQVLDVGVERIGERCLDGVVAFIGALGHRVPGVVDDIGVIAGLAAHRIGTRAAIEKVAAFATDESVFADTAHQDVVAAKAADGVVAGATVLGIGIQYVGGLGANEDIVRIVDGEDIEVTEDGLATPVGRRHPHRDGADGGIVGGATEGSGRRIEAQPRRQRCVVTQGRRIGERIDRVDIGEGVGRHLEVERIVFEGVGSNHRRCHDGRVVGARDGHRHRRGRVLVVAVGDGVGDGVRPRLTGRQGIEDDARRRIGDRGAGNAAQRDRRAGARCGRLHGQRIGSVGIRVVGQDIDGNGNAVFRRLGRIRQGRRCLVGADDVYADRRRRSRPVGIGNDVGDGVGAGFALGQRQESGCRRGVVGNALTIDARNNGFRRGGIVGDGAVGPVVRRGGRGVEGRPDRIRRQKQLAGIGTGAGGDDVAGGSRGIDGGYQGRRDPRQIGLAADGYLDLVPIDDNTIGIAGFDRAAQLDHVHLRRRVRVDGNRCSRR